MYVEYLNNLISYLVMLFSVFYVSLKKTILLYLKIYCILLGSSRVLAPPPPPDRFFQVRELSRVILSRSCQTG